MFESKRSTAPRIRAEDEHMQRWLKARTERRNWIELRRAVSSVHLRRFVRALKRGTTERGCRLTVYWHVTNVCSEPPTDRPTDRRLDIIHEQCSASASHRIDHQTACTSNSSIPRYQPAARCPIMRSPPEKSLPADNLPAKSRPARRSPGRDGFMPINRRPGKTFLEGAILQWRDFS